MAADKKAAKKAAKAEKKAARKAARKALEVDELKRELALAARDALEVIAARSRIAREQKERIERKKAREVADAILLIARWEASQAGWPESFADHLLGSGRTDYETACILKSQRATV